MHLVIIGNGIAGVSCAQTVRRLRPEARITLVSAESAHHFSRPALMYLYMGHLRWPDVKPFEDWYWVENRLELVHDRATRIDADAHTVHLAAGPSLAYDALLLATGATTQYYDWPGQDLRGVQGLVSKADVELMADLTRDVREAVVVGGGLIGVEMAEMLRTRGLAVTMLVRDRHYWGSVLPPEEAALVDAQLRRHGVRVQYGTELAEILGDASGRVRAVRTSGGQELPCQWLGVATGVVPNLALTAGTSIETDRGILVDEYLRTSVPGIFAAGDCAQRRTPPPGEAAIEPLWYTGRMQGETVAHTICGQPTAYQRGPWFNSAKFFDLEYQTYGQVPARPADGKASFWWQHPTAPLGLRLHYRADASRALLGVNALGLRLRHDVCDQWLRRATPVPEVLAQLGAANFDPEFFAQHEPAIVAAYNARHPDEPAVVLRRRKGLLGRLLSV
ncbi:NAD(P)/FAD-dependent oxidoreductase [Hymenobacter jeollabukensis]|uniref:NAD(P)/FAD-dependent oxidoreductase n=1 Tax=Hymenobacter jeollabukensis TaxID=2025313 RepID=A0A5R8WX10_9BACT|nr:FAD/NAD(P)-binding oxidoreductase [Hymenobacter jeollabukensis]TLM96714.1 NAD(P)/FAD-dependent oxidoreductase [Hymenobacter jeollabukensis]